jgi:hypothetical protein
MEILVNQYICKHLGYTYFFTRVEEDQWTIQNEEDEILTYGLNLIEAKDYILKLNEEPEEFKSVQSLLGKM